MTMNGKVCMLKATVFKAFCWNFIILIISMRLQMYMNFSSVSLFTTELWPLAYIGEKFVI